MPHHQESRATTAQQYEVTDPADPSRNSVNTLLGREADTRVLRTTLRSSSAGHAQRLLLTGGGGYGKSSLLRWTIDEAQEAGFNVVHSRGIRREGKMPLAGLHALFVSLAPWADGLPTALAQVVQDVVRGSSSANSALVFASLQQLVSCSAQEQPLLLVVDDAHWLDTETQNGLVYLARRLRVERVALLLAATASGRVMADWPGDILPIGPLDSATSYELLQRLFPDLASRVRTNILRAADGNPLILQELPQALTAAQRAGSRPLPEPLPLNTRCQRALAPELESLDAESRTSLLISAAAPPSSDLRTVLAALRVAGLPTASIAPAERRGMARFDDAGVHFTPPLLRSAIYWQASETRRRQAHAILAQAWLIEHDETVHSQASGSLSNSKHIGDDLEVVGRANLREGRPQTATHVLRKAAELSLSSESRRHRLLSAAGAALESGQPFLAAALAAEADEGALAPLPDRHALTVVGAAVESEPDVVRHFAELRNGLGSDASAPEKANAAFRMALLSSLGGQDGPAAHAADWLMQHNAPVPLQVAIDARRGSLAPTGRIRARLREFDTALTTATLSVRELNWLADAAWHARDLEACSRLIRVALLRSRAEPSIHSLHCEVRRCALLVRQGRWSEFAQDAERILDCAQEDGRLAQAAEVMKWMALVCAWQSRKEDALRLADRLRHWAQACAGGPQADAADYVTVLLAVTAGDATGVDAARRLAALDDPFGYRAVARHACVEIVRLFVRHGRLDEAQEYLSQHGAGRRAESQSSEYDLRFEHAWALLAVAADNQTEAEKRFIAATDAAMDAQWPLDLAFLQLDYGNWLRRQGRLEEARAQLRTALTCFERLEASFWADSARAQLRGSGVSVREEDRADAPDVVRLLSPQELRIAELAAQGLSNRQIAAKLYLSPRTVSSHLYRVFPKLGIASRRELGQVLPPRQDEE
ncbi:LuxR C-terminal-related transcriptional regulator [Streptomyces sp. NPDC090080]|uniref:helix-turn-helix transcriptional regulator n=1 Tax=Streptomyces sp. NPDC090080 TaxID=3365939 RepID=UPI00382F01D7